LDKLIPELENVMANFMECSQMIIGAKVRYCITYKSGQPDFSIFTRKQYHNFKVPIDNDNYEGALGANLGKFSQYVITQTQMVNICNMRDFQEIQEWNVIDEGNIADKETQILYMTVSDCQTRMGILLGKDLGRGKIDTTHLQIYENGTIDKTWKKMLSQKFDFDEACREFVFCNTNKELLYFFTDAEIFEYNYVHQQRKTKYTFQ